MLDKKDFVTVTIVDSQGLHRRAQVRAADIACYHSLVTPEGPLNFIQLKAPNIEYRVKETEAQLFAQEKKDEQAA